MSSEETPKWGGHLMDNYDSQGRLMDEPTGDHESEAWEMAHTWWQSEIRLEPTDPKPLLEAFVAGYLTRAAEYE